MVVEDFRKVNTALLVFLSSHPEIARAMEKRRLSASSVEALRDDVKYAFGGDFKTLPNIVRFVSQPNRLRSP